MFELDGVKFDKIETANGSKLIIKENKNGEAYIHSMLLKDVVLSYQFLTRPRTNKFEDDKDSNDDKVEFGADLIVFDQESFDLMSQYFLWDIMRNTNGKPSRNFKLSVKEPRPDQEAEKGAAGVVSVKAYNRIPMYDAISGTPVDVSNEEDLEAYIYSGAVVDVVISSYVWNNKFGQGLKPYINAVARVAEGTRYGGKSLNYVELFSDGEVVFGKPTETVSLNKLTQEVKKEEKEEPLTINTLIKGSTEKNNSSGGFDLHSLLKK